MSEAMNRREFLSRQGLVEMLRKAEIHKTDHEERRVMEGYLSSPLYSYALLSEMPWDMLIDEARRCGIPYEGRAKMDVVRELFVGTGGKEDELR